MIYETIKNFAAQFEYNPVVENRRRWKKFSRFIIVGMGGSHLAADLLKILKPKLNLIIHKNYGLPEIFDKDLKQCLIIFSSYSGNTEEVLDSYKTARKRGWPAAIIASNGKLLKIAQRDRIPYVQLPLLKIQPRLSIGYNLSALLKLTGENKLLKEVQKSSESLRPDRLENRGLALAKKIRHYVPIIYASSPNKAIAYNWKIKFNETAKIPAFYNVLPELNHNEMTGFDVQKSTQKLSKLFYFIFLEDRGDHQKIIKRTAILKKLYQDRGLPVFSASLNGKNVSEKIFNSLILADWTSYYLARLNKVESEEVPLVEEFKKLMK